MAEHIISRLPLSAWMSLLMLSGSWARPIEETVRVWLLSFPVFLLADMVRGRSSWKPKCQPAQLRGATTESGLRAPNQTRRFVIIHAPLAVLVLYLALLLFVPTVRVPATALDQTCGMERLYSVIGAWYPMIVHEPAQIIRLGHTRDASELRHFLAVALLLSMYLTYVVSRPGQSDLARVLLQKPRSSSSAWIGVVTAELGLAMFAMMGHWDESAYLYLELRAYVPCAMFALFGWLLASSIGGIGLLADNATVRVNQVP